MSSSAAGRALTLTLCLVAVVQPAAVRTAAGQVPEAREAVEHRLRRGVEGLAPAARIRLFAPALVVSDGRFLGVSGGVLRVQTPDAVLEVRLRDVEALEVHRSKWLHVGWQAAAVGVVAGAAAGFMLGTFACGEEVRDCDGHAGSVSLRYAVVFGSLGALVGGLVGSRMDDWRVVFP